MGVIADLHIHSRFSRATSSRLNPACLDRWARIKGIDLLGTGDCTHPAWLAELRGQLEEAEEGLYLLKEGVRAGFDRGPGLVEGLPRPALGAVRFVLTGELSTIYKRGDKTRKVHHLVILPDFRAAAAFSARLERVGNIVSDGRPILGIDSRDLLAMLLESCEGALLIPAHIWTPWFSVLGAQSGFDSIEECYGDLSSFIPAVETGLSSNPAMNWALSRLDRFAIISNSDAHSPDKLGREATLFDMGLSFASLRAALGAGGGDAGAGAGTDAGTGTGDRGAFSGGASAGAPAEGRDGGQGRGRTGGSTGARILGTIEFFPQEGKYHYAGHRNCGVCLSPEAAAGMEGICPVCGRPLTGGVMGRVLELADRPVKEDAPCPPGGGEGGAGNRRPYCSLIPLREILGEILRVGPNSRKVNTLYGRLIEKGGSEFALLMDMSPAELGALRLPGLPGELLAEGIRRMRGGEVSVSPGYDGEYGKIRVFPAGEVPGSPFEQGLFGDLAPAESGTRAGGPPGMREGPAAEKPGAAAPAEPAPPSSRPDLPAGAAEGPSLTGGPAAKEPGAAVQGPPSTGGPAGEALTLNRDQERALAYEGSRALIIAGPGTGKTALLAARIARLIAGGTDPASILALSFTVKAAAELRDRSLRMAGAAAAGLSAATFHSLCAAILREQGAGGDFRILGEEEREALLRELCAPGRASGGTVRPRRLGAYIEERKRCLLLPGEEEPGGGGFPIPPLEGGVPAAVPELEALYGQYRTRLRAEGLLDFEDLPAGLVRLFLARKALLEQYRNRYRHILVDEYQDINFAQYVLIRLLAPPAEGPEGPDAGAPGLPDPPGRGTRTLWLIGDPNQAIYGFRGSDKRFIDRFLEDYPGAARFKLTRSFRCAAPIMGAAGRLVGADLQGRSGLPRRGGGTVSLYRAGYGSEKSEAEGIARRIAALVGGTGFFAIDSGVASGRPENGAGGPPEPGGPLAPGGADRAGGAAPGDCAVLLRAAALAGPVVKALEDHGIPCELTGERVWWEEEPLRGLLDRLREDRRREGRPGTGRPGDTQGPGPSPEEEIRAAWEALRPGRGKAGRSPRPGKTAPEPVERLISLAGLFGDLRSLLDALALSGAGELPGEGRREAVRVMTIHAAKGLEFDHVFVPGLEEGILPFTLYDDTTGESPPSLHQEEERRILYVAMTRARQGLYLSWARSRNFRGRPLSGGPSRFLSELENLVPLAEEKRRRRDPQLRLF